jgi:surface polysaccharide O-acyltransferase-like enzyme
MEQTKDTTQPEKVDALTDDSKATTRIVIFDYLRTFVIILVLVHHTVLAYVTFLQLNPATPFTFAPVVDSQRWSGFDLIVLFNDIWFMALLFFISGLFVWRSLTLKGSRIFLRDRLIRLGIPFVIGVLLLIPLAYFPGQLAIELIYGGSTNYIDFWLGTAGFWSGPLWFLWLLLAFNVLMVILYLTIPYFGDTIGYRASAVFKRSLVFFGVLLAISTAAYLPMALAFGPGHWTTSGPFHFQTSRLLLYLVYFLAGTAVGAFGLTRGIFKSDGPLARHWWGWLAAGVVAFFVWLIIIDFSFSASQLTLPVFCATMVFAVIAIFLRFAKQRIGILDSLSSNSYGIYIIHYVFVNWLQYWLLGANLPAIQKASIVFTGTLVLSWGSIAAIRRIPAVARVI